MVTMLRVLLAMAWLPLYAGGVQAATAAVGSEDYRLTVSGHETRVRDQVLVSVEVEGADRFARLETDAPQIRGIQAVVLPFEREEPTTPAAHPRLRIGWALFPQAEGIYDIQLPPVRYRLGGRTEYEIDVPPQTIRVRPLPAYIPPTLSVGRPTIDSRIEPAGLLRPGHLAYWRIRLSGDALLPQSLPHVLQVIESNDHIEFLAPQSRRTMTPARDGVHGEVVHDIPFKVRGSGPVALPVLEIQYFDPASGRLATVRHSPRQPFALGMFWRLVAGLLIVGIVLLAGWRTIVWLRTAFTRRQSRRRALARLEASRDPAEALTALRDYARAEGCGDGLSLGQWQRCRALRYGTDEVLAAMLERLARARYGKAAISPAFYNELAAYLPRASRYAMRKARSRSRPRWIPDYFAYRRNGPDPRRR